MHVLTNTFAEYECVATSNNFTPCSHITRYVSTNSVWKDLLANFWICLSFELAGKMYNLD